MGSSDVRGKTGANWVRKVFNYIYGSTKMQQGAIAIANAQTVSVPDTPPMHPVRSMQGGNLFCLGSKKCNIS
jgi:hypothetical protein